ncbi:MULTISPECIES: hypothetical protein [unclassified Microbacterium]|uniref:hypothetical protein n=1 Tax=unclassified Microbacterium TaxID=2609290 RepID=UPI001C689E59|nr:hypothetical protein [Microbacterium sp. Se5.02b]QYM64703.1 hypothetical protein K1X59_02075 [Microbacterium sp. Se5.02b]
MYEHPYLTHQITQFEQEQMERAAAQRRFLIEHADQIVPRPAGAVRRMLDRVLGVDRSRTATARSTKVCETAAPAR